MQILVPTMSGPRRPLRFPGDNIADVIAKTLDKFGSNTAVRTKDGGDLSYRQLGMSASTLVGSFEAIGIRPGDAVILKLPRSVDLVVVIFATQMLGLVFVPVDPSELDQRLDHIIRNTKAKAIVSLDLRGSMRVERLPTRDGVNAAFPNIAYIMHTSGSTGIPKGVPVSQGALLNLIDWYIEMTDFSEGTSIAQLTRPAFDVSIPEFFLPFATGGTIVLPATQLQAQIMQTIEFLTESHANVIQMVPTLLRRFIGTLERLPGVAERFTDLKYVVCNGETLPDSLRRRFYVILPNTSLVNSYGPTECCVAVSYHYCRREDVDLPMFIGKPAYNVDFYILDESNASVGCNVEGELWVGGVQTSQRYVADEAQSKLRFVTFSTANGEQVLYRTGDYVAASEEDGLRFLGRNDDQIKYRGTRLEKGEITSAIDRTGLCKDTAVVVVDKDDDKGQDLVCMVTPGDADVVKIHRRLAEVLPNDRVPRLVVPLVGLPFTANGKLDQRALERIAKEELRANSNDATPQTENSNGTPLDHLLQAVHAVMGRWVFAGLTARECDIDSLSFLDIQLKLAEAGLKFGEDVYQNQDLSLGEWAKQIQPLCCSEFHGRTTGKSREGTKFRRELVEIIEYIENRSPSTIMLHSSLAALRNVTAKEVTAILLEGLERIAASATIMIPAFTLSYCSTRRFHWSESKSETGVLADLVMRELPAGRTKHPAYSMVVAGPSMRELCEVDWWRCSPFGDDSIFGEISRSSGLIVGLGTSSFTHVHRCEVIADVPYSKTINLQGRADFGGGAIDVSTPVYTRDVKARPEYWFLGHDTMRDIREMRDLVREFAIAGTYARLVDAGDMETRLVPIMRAEPFGFLHQNARADARRAYPSEERNS
ncbi:AMP-binding protein [Mesorhizobium neociceri]|uniref:aminoglycoside N(3)-acetyltransferase n=1 Tax=Mesorhizobium neociceri TaxID=1307853 RepID=A0A838B8U0_9HYPH|nr:AMP-binding protein [Mesorhizobium neociceri]MBA1142389.1 AMP-binding protein [Mesorhizobium neociceri]